MRPNFLGAGPAFPLREARSGFPDFAMAEGAEAVASVVRLQMRTAPGEFPFDPALGLDPEVLRYDPADFRSALEIHRRYATLMAEIEPRIRAPRVEARPIPRERRMDVSLSYALITRQVARNLVVLPEAAHEDVGDAVDNTRNPITGDFDSVLVGISL